MTAGLAAAIVVASVMIVGPVPAAGATFRDVTPGSTHADAIVALADRGITTGCGGGRFCPREPVTRAQMASFLTRALDLRAPGPPAFLDVAAGTTHGAAIAALADAGITTGCGNGRFCPGDPVTRDQMASFVVRGLDLPAATGHHFVDVAVGSTHADAVNALAEEGITAGCTADRYCPRDAVTREQMASFLSRGLGLVPNPGRGPRVPKPSPEPTPSPEPSPTTSPEPSPPEGGEPVPNGALLAFVREPISGCTAPCNQETAIWAVPAAGGDATSITAPANAYDRHPRWAPDGGALAFVRTPRGRSTGEIYAVDVEAGTFSAPRRVTSTEDAHGGAGCHGQTMAPAWSPDSTRLAVTCAAHTRHDAPSTVYVVGADGTGQFSVSGPTGTADAQPDWAPSGSTLAFARTDLTRGVGAPGRVSIWRAEIGAATVSGVNPVANGSEAANHPRWSPAGDAILYVATDEVTFRPRLRMVSATGGNPTTLYTPPSDEAVQLYAATWSPEGSRVALPVGDGLRSSVLHVIDVASGVSLSRSSTDVLAFAPDWAADGGRLVYDAVTPSASGSQAHALVVSDLDGQTAPIVAGSDSYAFDARWYPERTS